MVHYITIIFLCFLSHIVVAEQIEQIDYSRSQTNGSIMSYQGKLIESIPDDIKQVFDNIAKIAKADTANRRIYMPRLAIIDMPSKDAKDYPPQALSDGYVVLTSDFIETARNQYAEKGLFETLIAFIIGHEIAHLVRNDFNSTQPRKDIETESDIKGFLYATFAGYKIDLLAQDSEAIFTFLAEYFSMKHNKTHPDPKFRAGQLSQTWKTLLQEYPFYEYGVRLSAFDQCSDAINYFFSEFRQIYQGKEVLNNIGLCYLYLARQDMGDAAHFYWLPNMLSGDIESMVTMGSDVSRLQSLKSARLDEKVKGNLEAAIDHLRDSIDVAPYYFPSYINLAVAYLYLGKERLALLFLEEGFEKYQEIALKQNTVDKTIEIHFEMLRILARHENVLAMPDPWRNTINLLIQLLKKYEEPPLEVTFNLARLLEVGKRRSQAQQYWDQLAQKEIRPLLPQPILETVCNEQAGIAGCRKPIEHEASKKWSQPIEWTGKKGYDLLTSIEKTWTQKLDRESYDILVLIYQSPDKKWETLFFDSYPMVLVDRQPNETLATLEQYCPYALRKKMLVENEIYLCGGWAAKVTDGNVVEVWHQIS